LYIADAATANKPEILQENLITHVINLIAHKPTKAYEGFKYLNLSLKDTLDSDILSTVPKIVEFIKAAREDTEEPRI
jgi:hypothetical protein